MNKNGSTLLIVVVIVLAVILIGLILFLTLRHSPTEIVKCQDEKCFKEKFANCEPATFTYNFLPWAVVDYEIIGLEGKFCKMKSIYTEISNPEWEDKEIVCLFDNSKDWNFEVFQNIDKCKGPLYEIILREIGYDSRNESLCPEGTEWAGTTYTYENGEKIPHPICKDQDFSCPPCENCASGTAIEGISNNEVACFECGNDRQCKEGFHCSRHKCI